MKPAKNSLTRLKIVISLLLFTKLGIADTQNIPLPEVACRYELISQTGSSAKIQRQRWYFWRTANMIQTRSADGEYGEIWTLTATGSIFYKKLYHRDKTAVEYPPADQPIENLNFNWLKLANMLNQEELAELKFVKNTKVLGSHATIEIGKSAGQSLRVIWLPKEQLPASIIRKDTHGKLELRLLDIQPLAQASTQPVSASVIANYRHIDAADFGDMENDVFVKKLLSADRHHSH